MVMKKMETQSMRLGMLIIGMVIRPEFATSSWTPFQGTEPDEGEEMGQMGYLVAQDISSELLISGVMFVFHIELANVKL